MNKRILRVICIIVMLTMVLPTITAVAEPPIPLPDTIPGGISEWQEGRAFGQNVDRSVQRSLAHDVYADYFMIGTIIDQGNQNSPSLWDLFRWHFNAVTAHNHMKPHEIWPNPAVAPGNVQRARNMMGAANEADFYTIGHTFVWHNQSDQWPRRTLTAPASNNRPAYGFEHTLHFPLSRAEAEAQLHQFISTMGQEFHYPNPWAVNEWDVINEAFRDNPEHPEDWRRALRSGTQPVMRPSFWFGAYAVEGGRGWDYVWDSFILSTIYAPDAKRVYNDFNDEELDGKAIAIAEMVRELNARFDDEFPYPTVRSCPRPLIEEVGIQAHYNMRLRFDNLESVLQIYGELGIDISLTELDVSLTESTPISFDGIGGINSELYYEQAIFYARLMNILKEYRQDGFPITRVTWWGTSDQHNWRGGFHPMIWRRVSSLANLSATGTAAAGIHVPKESFWAVMDPEGWLNLNDFTGSRPQLDSFEFRGEVFPVERTRTQYDVHVPNDVTHINFTMDNLNLGEMAEQMIVDLVLEPADGIIRPGQPVTATVTMAWPGIEVHPRTHIINFGHMSADWLIDQNYSDIGYRSLLDVRFSDGETALTLTQDFRCETTGEMLYTNTRSFPAVPLHGRDRHVITTAALTCGCVYPTPLALCEDCQADQTLVRTVSTQDGQFFAPPRFTDFVTPEYAWMFADTIRDDTNYIFVNVATGMALAHEGRNLVLPGGGIEETRRGYWSSDPFTIENGMITAPAELQDNTRFYIRESFHPNVGPFTREAGFVPHTIQSLVHGGLIEPFIIWRAASSTPTVNMYSNNHIADRNLDRGAWLNTPIVDGQTTMFLFSGPETANPGIYALFGNDIPGMVGTGANAYLLQRGGFAAQRIEDPFNVPDNARFWVMEYKSNYTTLGPFTFDIFNNGEGGSPSRPNESLAQAGVIRMWAQSDGAGTTIPLWAADSIVALDQNGDCAIDFVRVNRAWVEGEGWQNYFTNIDVLKGDGEWEYINFSITIFNQTVDLLLVNSRFVPPVQETTITVNFPGMNNVRITYNVVGIGWVNLPGRHDDTVTFELPEAHARIDRIQVFCSMGGSNYLLHPITVTPLAENEFDVPVIPLRVFGINSLNTVQVGLMNPNWVVSMHNVPGPVEIADDIVFNVFRNERNYIVRLTNPGQNPSIDLVVNESNIVYHNGVYEKHANFNNPFYYVTVPTGITGVRVAGPNWIVPHPGVNAGAVMWFLNTGRTGNLDFMFNGVRHNFPGGITFDGTCIFCQVNMCDLHAPARILTTTIFAEAWRESINIRFFLDGELTALPLEDIEFIVNGTVVPDIRPFTVNIAGWQTSTNAVFICKLRMPWQNMTVNITAYGQTLTYHFVNNM